MKARDLFGLAKETFTEWNDARAPRLGAALAYYSVFSLAPLLVLVLAIAGLVFGKDAAEKRLADEIRNRVGTTVAEAVQKLVEQSSDPAAGWTATIISLATLLLGAMGLFVQLQDALNTIWRVQIRPGRTLQAMVKDRLLSFAAVAVVGFLLLVSLVVSAALHVLDRFLGPESLPGGATLWLGVNALVSFGFITLLFAFIFKILPDVRIPWRDVWLGAVLTALLFTLGKYLLGLYLGRKGLTSPYGAAGSLVIILLWVYYSSQVLLLGAAFTRVVARKYGTRIVPDDNAEFIPVEAEARQGISRPGEPNALASGGSRPLALQVSLSSTVRKTGQRVASGRKAGAPVRAAGGARWPGLFLWHNTCDFSFCWRSAVGPGASRIHVRQIRWGEEPVGTSTPQQRKEYYHGQHTEKRQ